MLEQTSLTPSEQLQQLTMRVREEAIRFDGLRHHLSQIIIGQEYMMKRLLVALLADGHVLLEGAPGLAKTLAIKSLAGSLEANFSRIQFTPDLLPADITGTLIYQQNADEFRVKKGPVFAHFVLADEINRAPAKVQSALLEAMQEKQVTIGETTFALPNPFLVMATQNPIEQEGTYRLPEAQLDRFMLKVVLGYPSKSEEQLILRSNVRPEGQTQPLVCVTLDELVAARKTVKEIYIDEKIEKYIVDIVQATRQPAQAGLSQLSSSIEYGASPRASINLALAAKAHAFLEKRAFVIPEDVRALAVDVIAHRIGLSYEAEADQLTPQKVIQQLVQRIEVP